MTDDAPALANPVFVPLYADPAFCATVAIAMTAEIVVALALLRRLGYPTTGLVRALVLMNIVTWTAFVAGVIALLDRQWPPASAVAAAEVLVVAVETVLIRSATHAWRPGRQPLGYRPAFLVSLVGNGVSIGVSIALLLVVVPLLIG